jgi:hypothetical protein
MKLTQDNFQVFAAMHYDNPQCLSEEEFLKDIAALTSIKRYISRLHNNENICLKVITNTIITFYNVFQHHAATQMIKFRFDIKEQKTVNSFLLFLNLPTTNSKYDKNLLDTLSEVYYS